MMYRFAFLSALFAGAAALSTPDEIPANSKLGSKLMSKARKVEQGQYYQNEEEQYNWVANYSIKFDQCHTVTTFGGEGAEATQMRRVEPHTDSSTLLPSAFARAVLHAPSVRDLESTL